MKLAKGMALIGGVVTPMELPDLTLEQAAARILGYYEPVELLSCPFCIMGWCQLADNSPEWHELAVCQTVDHAQKISQGFVTGKLTTEHGRVIATKTEYRPAEGGNG